MRRLFLLSFTLSAVFATRAAAQTCAGMPSFSTGQMQVAGGGNFTDGASSLGATFGYGVPNNLYGKVGIGSTSYDGLDGSTFDFGVSGGYQIALKSARKAELCPIASLSFGSGPDDVLPGVDMSSRTFAFGAGIGVQLGNDPQMRFVPTGSFQFANTRLTLDDGTDSASGSESYGLLTLGTGFVFNHRFSLTPTVSFPMGLEGSDASFGLAGAIQFGQ